MMISSDRAEVGVFGLFLLWFFILSFSAEGFCLYVGNHNFSTEIRMHNSTQK